MFRMRDDADRWFRKIADRPPIKTKLDLYYFCLMAGLMRGQLDDVNPGTDIYIKFPQEYEGSRYQVLGLLLVAEMHREGLEFNDKQAVQGLIARYLAADSPSNLSAEGFKKANGYASGGFNVLTEHFEDSPQDVNVFLTRYAALLAGHQMV